MTTRSWSSRIRHDSDALFREWGEELHDELVAAGLVQTADTGQIDWGTVTRASINSDAGYEIWRFDDTLQATAPIFIKLMYGTGSNASAPRLRLQVGTGTDGAGTLTGVVSSIHSADSSTTNNSDTTAPSYLCVAEGFFGLCHKPEINNQIWYQSIFTVERTTDTDGEWTADGAFIQCHPRNGSSMSVQYLQFSGGSPQAFSRFTGANDCGLSLIPQAADTSNLGDGDLQAYLCWMATPAVVPSLGTCVVYKGEIALGANFMTTLRGSTPRTYLGLGSATNNPTGPAANKTWSDVRLAMLWE